MSAPSTLEELYAEEMKDLWSANDQMTRAVKQLSGHASDSKLKKLLDESASGIEKHSSVLKELIKGTGEDVKPDHCKGMEGLVTEAMKHCVKESPTEDNLRDLEIIAQYQRMSHYGLAGFGSAAAYAKALGKGEDEKKLKKLVSDIYKSDEVASHLAEKLEKAAA